MLRRLAGVHRAPAGLVLAGALMLALAPLGGPSRSTAAAPPAIAYVTGNASETVWVSNAQGGEARSLGGGSAPLIAPNDVTVAASLSGSSGSESGPALALYPSAGGAPKTYLNRANVSAQPLAWSPDSRFLAVQVYSNGIDESASGLDLLDTSNGTLTTVVHGAVAGASFATDGSERLVYGLYRKPNTTGPVNLFVVAPGGAPAALTTDGRSLNPVWGPRGIVFDRQRSRKLAPEYQLWLLPTSGAARQLTHVRVAPLLVGLVPLALSQNGSRVLAEFEGEDTSEAWVVNLASPRRRASRLAVRKHFLQGAGISRDGSQVLVVDGALERPPSAGHVDTLPFGGGRLRVLIKHGAQASWSE